ncbi:unnamed protein product [Auanema sp. JU1783]|nr:unnamed protein product [Auanema sp. JU1783]
MADTTCGRLVSFLLEGDEVISCEVCMEPFDSNLRPPKILPCGHNFCEQCLFSLCCHQQYYLLDSINCPTCRASFTTAVARSAPTNYDLCKMLDNVQRGFNNTTVLHTPEVTVIEKEKLGNVVKGLAERSREAKHQRCLDCQRKLSSKNLSKIARYCVMCNNSGSLKFSCLECCVNNHNGHRLYSIPQMETSQLAILSELRVIRRKMLDASEAFDRRLKEIGKKGSIHTPALHAQKQTLLSEILGQIDEAVRKMEEPKLIPPTNLNIIRNHQIHNFSRITKMNSLLEKSVQTEKHSSDEPPQSRLKKSNSAIRQSRLSLRSDNSLTREALSTLLSILPSDEVTTQLSEILDSISPKDTIEERKLAYLKSTHLITEITYGDVNAEDLPLFADALLNCFYQLNVLSRKRNEKGRTSRKNIWKSVQFAYAQIMKIAAKSYPACHPERVDCLDDLAYLCHLFSDVCDQATVALLIIEAARARSAEANLPEDELRRTDQRLQMIDDHLIELRRLQKLQDLRSKTKIKREGGRFKAFWKAITGRR